MLRTPAARLVCVCLVLAGCSSADNPLGRQTIGGTVRLDGQPLDQGSIRFEPVSGKSAVSAGAVILRGSYQIASNQGLPPGSYKVWLSAPEVLPQASQPTVLKMGEPTVLPKERIPASYNADSQLVVDVRDGENVFDIDVETAPRK